MNDEILNQLQQIVTPDCLIQSLSGKKAFESEWRNRYTNPALAVIFPKNVTQIQQILQLCRENKIGLIPQGGNTSMCAGSIPTASSQPQLILNLSKLNNILEVDVANNSITVEAGCTLHQVQEAARNHGLYFPLSMGSEGSCQIGGNIATNAGGVHVIKYGTMRDLVLGLEVILPDGQVINQLFGLRKNNINFDLKQLFIGSEGTLGIITRASLKLFPQVQNYFTGLIGVGDLDTCISILNTLTKHYPVCAFEIINRLTQQIYNTHFKNAALQLDNEWLILFELEIAASAIENFTAVIKYLKIDLNQVILASNESERRSLWQMRENIPVAEKMAGFAVKHDISLPISNIEAFIQTNSANIKAKYPAAQIIIFGHLGDGNLHYNIQFPGLDYAKFQAIETDINLIVYTDVYKYNGSFSAEHGIGYIKKTWMRKYYDPVSYKVAQSIKSLLDPDNILNPGKIFS